MSASSSSTLNQLLTAPPNYRLKDAVYPPSSSAVNGQPTSSSQQLQTNTPPAPHQQANVYYAGQAPPQHPGYYGNQANPGSYQQQQYAQPPPGYGPPPPGQQYAAATPSSGYYGQPPYGGAPPTSSQQQQQPRYALQCQQQQPANGGPETAYGQPPPNYGQPWNQQPQSGGYPPQQQQYQQQPPSQQAQYYGHPGQYGQQQPPPQQSGSYYQQLPPPPTHQLQAPPANQLQQQSPAPQDQRSSYGIDGSTTFDTSGGNSKRPASRSSATGSSVGTSGPSTPNAGEKKTKRRKPSPASAAATPPTNSTPAAANSNQVFRPPHPVGQPTMSPYQQQNSYGAVPQQPSSYYGQPQQVPPGLGQPYRQSPVPYQQQQFGGPQQSHMTHPQHQPSPYAAQQNQPEGAPLQYSYSTPTPGSMGPPPGGQAYATPPTVRGAKSPAPDRSLSTTPSGPLPAASPKSGKKKAAVVVRSSDDGDEGSPPASPRIDGKSCELGLKPLYGMGDEPGRRPWLDALGEHLDSVSRTLGKQPTVAKRPLDMYLLYEAVKLRGGFLQITKKRQLREVCDEIGFGNSSGTAAAVKKHYLRICLSYECRFDRGGADCKQMARDIDDSRARARCRKRPTARQKAKAEAAAATAAAAGQPATNSTNNTTSTDDDSFSYASMDGEEDGGSNSRSTGVISRRASSSALGLGGGGAGSSSQMSAESGVVTNKQAGPGRPRKPRKKKLTKKELRAQEEAAATAAMEDGAAADLATGNADVRVDSRSLPFSMQHQQEQRVVPAVEGYGRQFPPAPAAMTEVQRNPHLQQLMHPTPPSQQQHPTPNGIHPQLQQLYAGNRTPTPRNFAPHSPIPPSSTQQLPVRSVNEATPQPAQPPPGAVWRPLPPDTKRPLFPPSATPRPAGFAASSLIPSMPVPLGSDSAAVWPKNLPEGCVENFKFNPPSTTRHRAERIKSKRWFGDKQSIDIKKVTMSLRCGLLSESSWALDTLAICLTEDANAEVSLFRLSHLPRTLFDGIVEWFAVLLYYAFPHETETAMQSLKHNLMQLSMGSPSSTAATPCVSKSTAATKCITAVKPFVASHVSPVRGLPFDRLPSSRIKIEQTDNFTKKPRLHLDELDNPINDNDFFLLDDDPVPDILRHYRPFVRTQHSCARTVSFELFCGSDKVVITNSDKAPLDDADRPRGDTEQRERLRRKSFDGEPAAGERSHSPDSGTALSPAEQQMLSNNEDDSNAGNNDIKVLKRTYDCEADNFGSPIFNLISTAHAELHQRLLVTIVILRNLSFIPSNEAIMARNATLFRFLGRLLLLHHTHSERRPLSPPRPKTDAEWVHEVALEQRARVVPVAQEDDQDRERSAAAALVAQLREHAFVILSNCAGFMELMQLPEDVAETIVHGLLYWSSTQCTAADEPFPVNEKIATSATDTLAQRLERLVTPKRIAIECLGKLTSNQSNIALIITTPPFSNVTKLFRTVSDYIALGRQDCVLRELCISILSALLKTEDYVVNALAKEVPQIVGHLLSFIEQMEDAARIIAGAGQVGLERLRRNPELMGTSLVCLRRCGDILYEFIQKLDPDYHCIVFRHQDRILELLMSQVLEQQVANNLAKVLLRLQSPVDAEMRRQREFLNQQNTALAATLTATPTSSSSSLPKQSTLLALLLRNKDDSSKNSSAQAEPAAEVMEDDNENDAQITDTAEVVNGDSVDDKFSTAASQMLSSSSADLTDADNIYFNSNSRRVDEEMQFPRQEQDQRRESEDAETRIPANTATDDSCSPPLDKADALSSPTPTPPPPQQQPTITVSVNGGEEQLPYTSPPNFAAEQSSITVSPTPLKSEDVETVCQETAESPPNELPPTVPTTSLEITASSSCALLSLAVYADDEESEQPSPWHEKNENQNQFNGTVATTDDGVVAMTEDTQPSE